MSASAKFTSREKMAIRLLHLADLHLGAHASWLGKRAEVRRADFQAAFEKAVEFALADENTIDAVLICGDLFDSHRPSAALISLVQSACTRLKEADKPVIILPGLHDGIAYPDCVYHTDRCPGAHVLLSREPVTLSLQGSPCHFYGMPVREGTEPGELFARSEAPGLHVGLVHGSLAGTADFDRFSAKAVFTREALAATRMDYIALGHFHNHQAWTEDGVTMAYAGSLVATSFSDTTERAFLVVELEPGATLTLRQTPCTVGRRLVEQRIDLAACTSSEDVAQLLLQQADADLLVRFVLAGAVEFVVDLQTLQETVRSAFFHVEIEDATTLSGSGLVRVIATEPTVRGMFATALADEMDDPNADRAVLEAALKAGLRRFLEEELL
ncbi:MAG: metallophosphoesterase family protein [Candidatus Xenobia bacterium]